jgi:hypothetical protein
MHTSSIKKTNAKQTNKSNEKEVKTLTVLLIVVRE